MRFETYDGRLKIADNHIPFGLHPKYRLLLLFDEEELKYQISNVAYAQGDVARVHDKYGHDLLNNDAGHYVHQFKDVCEDGNIDRVHEIINMAISECEKFLYKYTNMHLHDNLSLYNVECPKNEYCLEMFVPGTFSDTTCWLILRSVNEYIKARVLEDWASITFPEGASPWTAKRAEMEAQIRRCANMCGVSHQVRPSII